MNRNWKKRWVAALRSGQYKQTRKKLTNGTAFCCLGVLCNLEALDKGEPWDIVDRDYTYKLSGYNLPTALRLKAGLTRLQEDILMDLNDKARYDFTEIADYIEDNL